MAAISFNAILSKTEQHGKNKQRVIIGIKLIQVNHSKHSISEQRKFSFGIKQLIAMLQNVNDVEQKSAPALQRRLAYV